MKNIILTIGLLFILALSGCGYKEGVATTSQKSYLYFTGNVNSTVVSIDGSDKFTVQAGKNNQYSIEPGKHIVEVYRNENIIVKREIFIGDGIAKEIEVE